MESNLANTDEAQVDVLMAGYLRAVERHEHPDRELLIRSHPEFATELKARFHELDHAVTIARTPVAPTVQSTIIGSTEPTARTILDGRYRLIETIGEGGMGSVWMAEQQSPVKRKVAIKLIKAGMDSQQVLARFEAERQALAMMDHPNIAKVFDGGLTEHGRPYFVMEFVQGIPFTEYCDQARLALADRLKLFLRVCSAVQHAHYKGIVHRDLKPSNILISLEDGQPVPKVIDFGLAKAMHQSLTEHSIHTGYGVMLGTPLYMSPEQADRRTLDIDTRTDIYSLGVVLYELLTGSTPLERQQLEQAGLDEILRLIKDVEPLRPSIRLSRSDQLSTIAALRSIDPRRLSRCLAGDLDWIVMKALEKERSRRYETAIALARDIERFLNQEPVDACPPSATYRFRKFVQRHRGQVIAASTVVLTLLVGIVGTSWGMLRAEYFRSEAVTALEEESKQKRRAEASENLTLENLRENSDDVIEHLIGSRNRLNLSERTYLERSLARWQTFASRQGDDELSQQYQGEGHFRIGVIWFKLGKLDAATTAFKKALERQRKLSELYPENADYQNDLAATLVNLGSLLIETGEHSTARRNLEQARNIQRKLADSSANNLEYQRNLSATCNNLGRLLIDTGELELARLHIEQARDLQQQIVHDCPGDLNYRHDLAISHCNLGILLRKLGEVQAAQASYNQALAIQRKVVDQYPTAAECRGYLGRIHYNRGDLLQETQEHDAAEAEYLQAINIHEKLIDQFPGDPEYRMDLAKCLVNLGSLKRAREDLKESQHAFERALELQQKLANQFTNVPEYQVDLATIHNNLAGLNLIAGGVAAAQSEFELARGILETVVKRFPKIPEYQRNLAGTECNLGGLFRDQGKLAAALAKYNAAIERLSSGKLAEIRETTTLTLLRNSHFGRAAVHREMGLHAEAAADWEQCMALTPLERQSELRLERADAWMRSGRYSESIAEVEELIRLGMTNSKSAPHWSTNNWYHFACLYSIASGKSEEFKSKYAEKAVDLLRYVMKTGFKSAADRSHMAHDTDLDPLRDRDDFKELMRSHEFEQPKPPDNPKPRQDLPSTK